MAQQMEFQKIHWRHRYCYGGTLRKLSRGRGQRPLSSKDPIHLIFKCNFRRLRTPKAFSSLQELIRTYAKRFFIKVEMVAINHDHVHLLIRAGKRSRFQSFFRVVAGQFSQRMTGTWRERYQGPKRIWKHRPFTRVIKGWKPYLLVRDYIQLNLKEASGEVPYRKKRLKGLSIEQLQSLWN
jgi:REP element-mobilizing transposase RayT